MKFNTRTSIFLVSVSAMVFFFLFGVVARCIEVPITKDTIKFIGTLNFVAAGFFGLLNIAICSVLLRRKKSVLHQRYVLVEADSSFGKERNELFHYLTDKIGALTTGDMPIGAIICNIGHSGRTGPEQYTLRISVTGIGHPCREVTISNLSKGGEVEGDCSFAKTAALEIACFARDVDKHLPE